MTRGMSSEPIAADYRIAPDKAAFRCDLRPLIRPLRPRFPLRSGARKAPAAWVRSGQTGGGHAEEADSPGVLRCRAMAARAGVPRHPRHPVRGEQDGDQPHRSAAPSVVGVQSCAGDGAGLAGRGHPRRRRRERSRPATKAHRCSAHRSEPAQTELSMSIKERQGTARSELAGSPGNLIVHPCQRGVVILPRDSVVAVLDFARESENQCFLDRAQAFHCEGSHHGTKSSSGTIVRRGIVKSAASKCAITASRLSKRSTVQRPMRI